MAPLARSPRPRVSPVFSPLGSQASFRGAGSQVTGPVGSFLSPSSLRLPALAWPGDESLSPFHASPGLGFLTLVDWAVLCWVSPGHHYRVVGLRDRLASFLQLPSNPSDLANSNFTSDYFPTATDEDLQLLQELEAKGFPIDLSPVDF